MNQFLSLIEPLSKGDWNDVAFVNTHSGKVFDYLLENKKLLTEMMMQAADNPAMINMCEDDGIVYKVALYTGSEVRIRFHVFKDSLIDRAHDHRWTFSAKVLLGKYVHTIFDADTSKITDQVKYSELRPYMIRNEIAGSFYTLHHNQIHTLLADAGSVSIMLRGPAMKEKMLLLDKELNETWWQYGAANDKTVEDKKNVKLTRSDYLGLMEVLRSKNIIA
jgi:hypothetical protein